MIILSKVSSAVILLLSMTATFANNTEKNTSVFVDAGGEVGQALLVSHGGACYGIVPTHVVADGAFITVIGKGLNPPIGDALDATDLGYDLSVISIEGEITLHCGPVLDTIDRSIEERLRNSPTVLINMVNPDGSISRIPAAITDQGYKFLRLQPLSSNDTFMKGMSGSYVTVGNKPLGILLSVDSETGEGKVIRIDRALETINPYFKSMGSSNQVVNQAEDISQGNIDAKVVKWTVRPIDEAHRAVNLLSKSETDLPWIAQRNNKRVQIIIELKGTQPQEISQITLSGKGLENDKLLARQVEILVDASGKGRWKSIKAITVPQNGGVVTASFSPRPAKTIMLQIYDNWGDREKIGLGKVYISKP